LLFRALRRLAPSKIADDIEGGEVDPPDDTHDVKTFVSILSNSLTELLDQKIHMLGGYWLLPLYNLV